MTIFEEYLKDCKLQDGNVKKIYDGYHNYRLNSKTYRVVFNVYSLVIWENFNLRIPKSTYKENIQKTFDGIIKNDFLTADKEDLKDLIILPKEYICIDKQKHLYNGKTLNLMLKINNNTRFPMSYKITKDEKLLLIYKQDFDVYRFQGLLCPYVKKPKQSFVNITSM